MVVFYYLALVSTVMYNVLFLYQILKRLTYWYVLGYTKIGQCEARLRAVSLLL